MSAFYCHMKYYFLPLVVLVSFFANSAYSQGNVLEDRETLIDLLGNSLACRLSEELLIDLEREPLYAFDGGNCSTVVDIASQESATTIFADAQCQTPVSFSPMPQQTFCTLALDEQLLGDGGGLSRTAGHPEWTLSPGTRFDLGSASLRGLSQPYLQRVNYKQIETAEGTCNLEMRIYKNSIAETGLKPMVALHGGSWRARGFGFLGLEMTVPQFSAQGYVVFAPFYRLIDDKEAVPACHNATIAEVREDAADALQWVIENAATYGASDYPTVFGQSAGAHLATSLAVDFPEQIANAVLFYPPTDFSDFGLRVQDGRYTNEEGLGILEAVLGVPAVDIDLSQSPIPENTFPIQVLENPARYPPMFILHGLADELVEATQSTRLCGALAGDIESVPDREVWLQQSGLRDIVGCDQRSSQLHLIREGDHALDVCVSGNVLLQDLCLAGSVASRTLVADSVASAREWASSVATTRAEQREALLLEQQAAEAAAADLLLQQMSEAASQQTNDNVLVDSTESAVADSATMVTENSRSGGSGSISMTGVMFALFLLLCRLHCAHGFHALRNFQYTGKYD